MDCLSPYSNQGSCLGNSLYQQHQDYYAVFLSSDHFRMSKRLVLWINNYFVFNYSLRNTYKSIELTERNAFHRNPTMCQKYSTSFAKNILPESTKRETSQDLVITNRRRALVNVTKKEEMTTLSYWGNDGKKHEEFGVAALSMWLNSINVENVPEKAQATLVILMSAWADTSFELRSWSELHRYTP